MSTQPVYCMDTSSLIEAGVRSYRPASFPSFWEKLERLIAEGRCVVCEEVRTEIEQESDELSKWVKQHPPLVTNFDRNQELAIQEVMREFPGLVNLKKNKGWADGFVIALAKCRGYTVVTEEGPGTREGPKIPFVCKQYGINCMNLASMIERERWRF